MADSLTGKVRITQRLCPTCKEALKDSQRRAADAYKSCPNCSRVAGEHVYHRFPQAFGTSEQRAADGAQSWCVACRKDKNAAPIAKGQRCNELTTVVVEGEESQELPQELPWYMRHFGGKEGSVG